jgi:hypothetical protein
MRKLVLLIAVVVACTAAPQALAAAPVLVSANATNLYATATWTLPTGVEALIVEVASVPTVDADGYFQSYALEAGGLLTATQTTWTDVFQLEAGRTYYVHVGGKDTTCTTSCPAVVFSNVISFVASGATGPDATPFVTLSIQKNGAGSGKVVSNPSGLDCGTACSRRYLRFIHVTLTPVPAPGSVFTGWDGGGCSGFAPTCEVILNVGQTVVATFEPTPPPSLPGLVVARTTTNATATVTVCDDSTGPLTIALIQIWQDRGQWTSATTTTTQNHAAGCGTHIVSGPLAVQSIPAMWLAVQVTNVDGRQSSLRTAPAP